METAIQLTFQDAIENASQSELARLGDVAASFLTGAVSSTGRATFYNTKAEQAAAEKALHEAAFAANPDLYAILVCYPGILDRAREQALTRLLAAPGSQDPVAGRVVPWLVGNLPIQRALRAFLDFRKNRINNARTRRLILRTLLREDRIELWAVKYRDKMRLALEHALGKRRTSILRSILAKEGDATYREMAIMRSFIGANETIAEALRFIFEARHPNFAPRWTLPLIQAFELAKRDLTKGNVLPPEVLEGIRSVYHKDVPKEQVLEICAKAGKLSGTQAMQIQKRAEAARAKGHDVQVEWDPNKQDAVKLYLYAFENGIDRRITAALCRKAEQVKLPADLGNIGILFDASRSMFGDQTQKLRPMAIGLAVRDVLATNCEHPGIVWCGANAPRELVPKVGELARPSGATNLARGLVKLLKRSPDSIFVISDGYENVSAGRFAEVVDKARSMGVTTPIYQVNPVFAAETKNVRHVAEGFVPTLTVSDPKALETGLLVPLLTQDPKPGLLGIYRRIERLIG